MENLQEILSLHKEWLESNKGQRADLRGANLQGADLQYADLRRANLQRADLQCADLRRANLQDADLRRANLRGANLQDANLQGADLDYSCLPLWCGSKRMIVDIKFVYQLLAHVSVLDCSADEFATIKEAIKPYAEKSHRWGDLNGL